MSDDKIAQSIEAKNRGNEAFKAQDYETAIKEFSAAIELDPTNHVFYSNRSGSYASIEENDKALADAEKCIEVKPDWAKGFSRKGLALFQLGETEKAQIAYEAGLELKPDDAALKKGLEDVKNAGMGGMGGNPMGKLFDNSMWGKLQADPTTRKMLDDPAFVNKMKMMQSSPNAFGQMAQDPQVMAAMGVILGIGAQGMSSMAGAGGPGGMPGMPGMGAGPMDVADDNQPAPNPYANLPSAATASSSASSSSGATVQDGSDDDADEEMDVEELARKNKIAKADAEKAAGNAHYKKKEFAEALARYDAAIAIDGENIAYLNNKAAVFFEQKEYEKCVETTEEAVKISKQAGAQCKFQDVAKAYARRGNAYVKMDRLDDALTAYSESLLEDRVEKVNIQMKKVKAMKIKADAAAYIDPKLSEEAKLRGNAHFKEGKWVDAIAEYTDALKRDPENFKVYSNRAGCYSKLMDWQRALDDCESCLKADVTFVKAYIRKAKVQHFLKQYHKALSTYDEGLKLDPKCSELIQGRQQTMRAVNEANSSGVADPQRQAEAMKDPEIQQILRDPSVTSVLQQMQTDPQKAQKAFADPVIRAKIDKLIAAGVLQVQ